MENVIIAIIIAIQAIAILAWKKNSGLRWDIRTHGLIILLALQCSTKWAMNTHMLGLKHITQGTDQFIEFTDLYQWQERDV